MRRMQMLVGTELNAGSEGTASKEGRSLVQRLRMPVKEDQA
ncbi:hypothetical protein E2C01_092739 [Portunus trituberculatus]|uniref:Uncharacterized protein n=1 Tax=Portunus trituberculatus TaxID=210409 RepID=A0A5B7JYI3_PORTR|nr:hypothetical protein [Portunus trituberculatus]